MKSLLLSSLAGAAGLLLLSSCLFTDPVFETGVEAPDASLSGVWVKADTRKDPRHAEYAVAVPLGGRMLIHHPAGPLAGDGGSYYEAGQLKLHGRTLLQLRQVANFKSGPARPSDKTWTVVWVERRDGEVLTVRALKGQEGINSDPASVRAALEGSPAAWESRFGEPDKFERLPAPSSN